MECSERTGLEQGEKDFGAKNEGLGEGLESMDCPCGYGWWVLVHVVSSFYVEFKRSLSYPCELAFYASVEELERPEMKTSPMAVGVCSFFVLCIQI